MITDRTEAVALLTELDTYVTGVCNGKKSRSIMSFQRIARGCASGPGFYFYFISTSTPSFQILYSGI